MSFFDALGNALGTMAGQLQAEQDKINIYVGDYEHLSSYELKKYVLGLKKEIKVIYVHKKICIVLKP